MSIDEALAVLRLTPGASKDEMRRAYLREVKRWHPDNNSGSMQSNLQMKLINEARRVLDANAGAYGQSEFVRGRAEHRKQQSDFAENRHRQRSEQGNPHREWAYSEGQRWREGNQQTEEEARHRRRQGPADDWRRGRQGEREHDSDRRGYGNSSPKAKEAFDTFDEIGRRRPVLKFVLIALAIAAGLYIASLLIPILVGIWQAVWTIAQLVRDLVLVAFGFAVVFGLIRFIRFLRG